MATQVTEAEARHDTRGIFDGLRKLHATVRPRLCNATLKSRDNTTLSPTAEARLLRWTEHHTEQLNVLTHADPGAVDAAPQRPTAHHLDRPIQRGEVCRALRQMRTSKAPGVDGIEAELLRALDHEHVEQLFGLIQDASLRRVPQEWRDACIINVPKKDTDTSLCDNWRGI